MRRSKGASAVATCQSLTYIRVVLQKNVKTQRRHHRNISQQLQTAPINILSLCNGRMDFGIQIAKTLEVEWGYGRVA